MTSQKRANHERQAQAKKPKVAAAGPKRIGFLGGGTAPSWVGFMQAFRNELALLGWNEGQDFVITPKYAGGVKRNDDDYAKNLAPNSDILVTAGTLPLLAAINATATSMIPVVVASAGFTGSIPSNVTGYLNGQSTFGADRFTQFSNAVGATRLDNMAVMANVAAPNAKAEQDAVVAAATAVHPVRLDITDGESGASIQNKIQGLPGNVKSLYVCTDPLITMYKTPINQTANAKQFPTMYQFSDHVVAGGLMSYGPDFTKLFRNAAAIVSRYLNQRPLPPVTNVDESDFELVWNRATAANLGLTLPADFNGVIVD
jgi:putative tryptophan/tyrosine transport system substrate-binding protein